MNRRDPAEDVLTVLLAMLIAVITYLALTERADARPADWRASSTSYCLRGRMADGTIVRPRSAASNRHPLGTRLRLVGAQSGPGGLRRYVVRDRIGHGSELDLWHGSCATARRYGRRVVRYRIGWAR